MAFRFIQAHLRDHVLKLVVADAAGISGCLHFLADVDAIDGTSQKSCGFAGYGDLYMCTYIYIYVYRYAEWR